jgi:hypothetical protein
MRWHRQHWLRKRRPYPGVSRQMGADSLIDRLLRSADSAAAPSGLAPDVLAEEIGVKLREHGGVSRDTVVGRIGAGFRSGDNANLQVEHGDLLVQVSISVHERDQYEPGFAFDDDEDFNFDDEDLDEDRK